MSEHAPALCRNGPAAGRSTGVGARPPNGSEVRRRQCQASRAFSWPQQPSRPFPASSCSGWSAACCLVCRASIGNRQQLRTLFLVQGAFELDVSFNERECGHCLRRAYIAMVMDVHEPSAARSRSYGVGPLSVPPTDVGSSLTNWCGPAVISWANPVAAPRTMTTRVEDEVGR